MSCFGLTHAPVATAARAAATGLVSMSTRPDPEGSGTVEIVTRRCSRLRVVLAAIGNDPEKNVTGTFQVWTYHIYRGRTEGRQTRRCRLFRRVEEGAEVFMRK